jgi:16S rRNA (cytosine1402-N4)-methyltransferase
MNPQRGSPASVLLQKLSVEKFSRLLLENADESDPALASSLAGKEFQTTRALADAIRAALPGKRDEERELSVRRVFQALRIEVNDEFSALETFLRNLPACLNPGGRVAILTFHSGEDRRVKKAFEAGLRDACYSEIANAVVRPSAEERRANLRAASAKLRWARRRQTFHVV